MYQHTNYPNASAIPGHIVSVPKQENFNLGTLHTGIEAFRVAMQSFLAVIGDHDRLKDFNNWANPEAFTNFFASPHHKNALDKIFSFEMPAITESWMEDSTFAQQFLFACNPTLIEKKCFQDLKEIEEFFPDPTKLANFTRFQSVAELLGDAKTAVYIVDHQDLLGIAPQKGYVLYAPKTLLYIDDKQKLMPLAINLRPSITTIADEKQTSLFYPTDSPMLWLYAKMCVGNADANYHEVVTHLGLTHLVMESIIVSAHEIFENKKGSQHPIYRLLYPHFHGTIFINSEARSSLISEEKNAQFTLNQLSSIGVDGGFNLLNKVFSKYKFLDYANLEKQLIRRGMLNPGADRAEDLIKNYYYRDYGLLLWNCIRDYVNEIIQHVYGGKSISDTNIANDVLLQKFLECCASKEHGNIFGFPIGIKTHSELSDLLTSIIWNASGQHAAVNFPQYEYYSFIPNHPLILHSSLDDKAVVNERWIVESLPNKDEAIRILILSKLLTIPSPSDLTLSATVQEKPSSFCCLSRIPAELVAFQEAYERFVENLTQAELNMMERNKEENSSYRYLYPSSVPRSVAI